MIQESQGIIGENNATSADSNGTGIPFDSYPFYIIKNRRSISRRRSSLQSWQQRHRFKIVRRLVRKSGKSSIHQKSSTERSYRFLLDLSNTLIESSWIWTLLVVSFVFILTWVMFAGFWAIISRSEQDTWNGTTCLEGIETFSGYLLFSIETQTSIGYGGRYINENCPEAIIGLCVQLIIGAGVCGSLICVVFLKMVGPLKAHSMVCFSRKAVICQRDGELCLIFRVRDYDMRYECHTKIVAYLAEEKRGELSLKVLKLQPTGILIWPVEVIHKIDKTSPFWDLSAKDLILKRFEIIVVLEGECLATSHLQRTTTSYLSREIMWGRRFIPCTKWDRNKRKYVVDHKQFNKTEEMTIPLCSAQRLTEVYEDITSYPSPFSESIPSSNSKYSSPSTMSPQITVPKHIIQSENLSTILLDESSSSEGDLQSTKAVIAAEIHYRPNQMNNTHECESSSSSGVEAEEYTTFMDLSVENLARKRGKPREDLQTRTKSSSNNSQTRPRTLSGTAKDFLANFQKYVTDGVKRNSAGKTYEETSF